MEVNWFFKTTELIHKLASVKEFLQLMFRALVLRQS